MPFFAGEISADEKGINCLYRGVGVVEKY